MPAILKENLTKLSENLTQSFKKSEKENYENHLAPTVKQVLSAKIEYEEIPNYSNTLNSLQAKYIVLKPNQQPLNVQHDNLKTQLNNANEKNNLNGSSTSSSSNKLPQPKRILFSREKVLIGWNHNGQTRNWSSGCGFNNIGNTCYLNSALQAFFHVPALAQWLISDKEHREKGSCKDNQPCLICAMSNTLLNTQRASTGSFTPSQITNRLSHICKHLTLGRQEDAHEFLRYLIEKMEKAFLFRYRNEPWFKDLDQHSKETTPLNQILGGYLRSTVTCFSCNHESVTFQHFQDLPLDITRVQTLIEAISGYFSRENLEECGYKCESCKKRVSASKRFSLERAPVVLCIQLKRFTAMGGKLSKHIAISEKLNLQRYLSKSSDQHQNCLYRFVSMVTHLGSSSSGGHYTAVGMAPNGNFYTFDDCRVSSIMLESALRGNAYVLFYELVPAPKSHESSMHNGHSIFHENGHTYVKNGLEMNINGNFSASKSNNNNNNSNNSNGNNNYEKLRANDSSFSKPNLPKLIPSNLIKHQMRQKESEPLSKNDNKSSNSCNGNTKNAVTNPSNNSCKKDDSLDFEQDQKNDIGIKRLKIERSPLPSVPRLSDENDLKSPIKQSIANIPSPPTTPSKFKSLVPYDDDDDDESLTICKTSSGIFIETDFKENTRGPSKQGSTISTKASISKTNEQQNTTNGKHMSSSSVVRNDDPISQLKKLNHSGYGNSNIQSWNNKPTVMNKEVVRDQNEDRKRHFEDDEDEMDRGRVKKIKYNNYHSNSPTKGKLPNPFNEHQNMLNSNGNDRYYDRPVHNGYSRQNFNNSRKNFYNNKKDYYHKDYKHNNRHYRNNHQNFNFRR